MISNILRVSVFGHCTYSVTFPYPLSDIFLSTITFISFEILYTNSIPNRNTIAINNVLGDDNKNHNILSLDLNHVTRNIMYPFSRCPFVRSPNARDLYLTGHV